MKKLKIKFKRKIYTILIDNEDYKRVTKYNWHINRQKNGYIRVCSSGRKKPNGFNYLHQFILNARGIDHIDRNTLNNQKKNLRKCSQKKNSYNAKKKKNNTSGYIGVTFDSYGKNIQNLKKCWVAQIKVNYNNMKLGRYLTAKEAAIVRDKAAKKYFGKFANLNFKV